MTAEPIRHHISDAILMAYAAGSLPEAFSLVVATHVSMCDACRAQVMSCEAVGGAVMNDAVAMSDRALEATLARLGSVEPAPAPKPRRSGVFPAPLADYVGGDVDAVRWSRLAGGAKQAILKTAKGSSARLLLIPAGQSVPDHSHGGLELTLVLQGAFADSEGRFGPGDVETASDATDHKPVAEPGMDCICLAATDAPLRFHGLFPKLLQPFFRI